MKKVFFLIITLVGLYSCVTRERCLERFPPEKESRTDSSYVEKDMPVDTIIELPGDTVFIHIENPCDSNGRLRPFSYRQGGTRANLSLISDGNTIQAECLCEAEKRNIRLYERWRLASKNTYKKEVVKVPRKITFIEVFLIVSGAVGLVLLVVFSIIKIRAWLIKRAISAGINSM